MASKKSVSKPNVELKKRLDAGLSEVSLAEKSLEAALGALKSRPRAEKVSVDKIISEAFIRLRTAHTVLLEIKQLVDDI